MAQIEPNNLYRYTLTDRLGLIIAQPIGESDFTIEWSRDNDNGKRAYGKEFGGNIIFTGEAYTRLLKMETSIYRCEYQSIQIERSCVAGGVRTWSPWFVGQVSLNEGEWDLDGCKVTMKFEEDKPDQCFEDNKNEKINLFQETYTRRTVNMFPANVSIETEICSDVHGQSGDMGGYYWCGEGEPWEAGWTAYYHSEQRQGGVEYYVTTHWARQVMTLPCNVDAPPDWILIDDNCPTNRKFAKAVNTYDCRYTYGDNYDPNYYSYTMDCKIFGQSSTNTVFDNGIPLENVIQAFVQKFCPGITVKSDFFQINPEVVSDINYVTNAKSKVQYITVYQKSDVKRPNATGNASKMEWSFDKLMSTLKFMFNVEWRIVAGKFIIEHVSFFTKNTGLNLTTERYKKYVKGKRKYSYKNDSIPKQEVWTWKEQNYYGDFPGTPIVYDNGCVTAGSRNAIKTYAVEDVMTDVEFAISNPAPDSTRVSDDGLVFIAAERSGTAPNYVYSIITEAGILEASRLNNSLAFAQLMRDYHKYERPLKVGRLNNVTTEFLSVIPTKKGETISVPFCCEDEFNPDDLIVTPLGLGVVDKATFNFKGSTMELELLYEANVGLVNNHPPVAVNEVATTYVNEPVIVDVLANDTDEDPDATVMAVEIMMTPQNGVVEVMPDKKVKYTPNSRVNVPFYVANENTYMNKNGVIATNTLHFLSGYIDVKEGVPYQTVIGNTLTTIRFVTAFNSSNVALPSYGSDSSINSFMFPIGSGVKRIRITGNMATKDTIRLRENQPFSGTDYFTYRFKDNWGQPSNNGLVSITVRPANTPPVANPNTYAMFSGNVLNVSAPGVLANDTDDFGFTLDAYDAVTAHGGTVVMQPTGAFTYTPPAGYLGQDTFTYSIKDDRGLTATATVTVTIRNINFPVASPDSYQTQINSNLVVNGTSNPKLTANDSNPGAGGATALTVTPETKATAQGGTVGINSDGTFTYSPATGFTGVDSFTYTVNNEFGSDIGNVEINVVPVVYVRMVQNNYDYTNVPSEPCPGYPEDMSRDTKDTVDIIIQFFSNSAGTIPLDVTGLNLKINIREGIRNSPGGTVYNYDYQVVGQDAVWLYMNDFALIERTWVCGSEYYAERTIELRPGTYTII